MRAPQRVLGVALLVLCSAVAVLLAYRANRRPLAARDVTAAAPSGAPGTQAGPVRGSAAKGAPTEPDTGSFANGVIPENVPDIHMPDLTGRSIALGQFLGHPLIINFWATWCAPCRREMPLLQQLWSRDAPEGLRIVGIAVDTRDAVDQYLRGTKVGYPLLVGEEQATAAASRFGIEPVLPFSVFADARGRIVAVKIGELHPAEADYLVAALRAVDAGGQTLPQARLAIATHMRALAAQRAKSSARPAVSF